MATGSDQHKNERAFVTKIEAMAKTILKEDEDDIDHPMFNKIGSLILSTYDKKFFKKANSEGLTDDDYTSALSMLDEKLKEYRQSAAGKKAAEKWQKKLDKENSAQASEDDDE
ncbi:MAG: hypothetical protein V4649_10920 [Bacteroidota bacterium]